MDSILSSLGFRFFRSDDEYLLIFRGDVLDHHVLLRQGESFLHATCVLSRAPDPLPTELASALLEWNAAHSLARMATGSGQILALAELPAEPPQGLTAEAIEPLLLSVVAAAEEFSRRLLPEILNLLPSEAVPGVPLAEAAGPTSEPIDSEIDWDADDA